MENIMRKRKPRLRDYQDQAIVILEQQTKDKNFTRYAKAVLSKRYLSEDISLDKLYLKLKKTKSDFEKEIIWDAITTKLLVEQDLRNVMKANNLIMEKLPIDYLVKLTQNAIDPQIRSHAKKVCYEKQLDLEQELGLEIIDYEKFEQDFEQDNRERDTSPKHSKDKSKISKSDQFNQSITIKKFLQTFYGISCQEERVTHEAMEQILRSKGISIPKRGRLQSISIDQVVTGEWILVRDGNKKRNTRTIPYMNPHGTPLEKLSKEIGVPYQKIR